jgi:hypothetical protein
MRDLHTLCLRLDEVFDEDDVPDRLSQDAKSAIEELWEERDKWRDMARQVLEGGRLKDSLWEGKALELLGDPEVYCGCKNPEWKIWKTGRTYCTHCGWHQRPLTSPTGAGGNARAFVCCEGVGEHMAGCTEGRAK